MLNRANILRDGVEKCKIHEPSPSLTFLPLTCSSHDLPLFCCRVEDDMGTVLPICKLHDIIVTPFNSSPAC